MITTREFFEHDAEDIINNIESIYSVQREELNEAGYNKFRHSFLKHEVAIIVRHLGEP